jgi:DNA polymerase I
MFDPPVQTFRHEQYPEYKAGRAETPDDLHSQVDYIRQLVDALGVMRLEVPGFEADDVIGTVTKAAERQGLTVRILTSDRDSYQLLSAQVKVINSRDTEVGPEEVLAEYGVTVEQWLDFRAMTGDSSDNIPGAKGVGPKGAQKLLAKYGSLDAIFEQLRQEANGEVKPDKDVKKIADSLENVKFSKLLSRIVTDVPLPQDWQTALERRVDKPKLAEMLRKLEFVSMLRELGLEDVTVKTGSHDTSDTNTDQPSEHPLTSWLKQPTQVLPWESGDEYSVFAYAMGGKPPGDEHVLAITHTQPPHRSSQHPKTVWQAQGDAVAPALSTLPMVVHAADAKRLCVYGQHHGFDWLPGDDPWLLAYVLDPNNTEPQAICQRYLQLPWPDEVAEQALTSASLLHTLSGQLEAPLNRIYDDIERPVAAVLVAMEARGVMIDVPYFQHYAQELSGLLANLEVKIIELAGEVFNVNSPKQLEVILYDKLQLTAGKKTKLSGQRSTAVAALEPLRAAHPIITHILEYRELAKLKGTYLEPLPAMVNPRTGRLHTTFSQTTAATGRLASLNPNLQNIPVRSAVGREIRKGFITNPGMQIMSADYSQIELRILAHITGESTLITGFAAGEDIHRRTAATIFGVASDLVSDDQRRVAKTINYGVLYGMSAHRLSNELGIPYSEAAGFIEKYFATYPGIAGYIAETKAFCHQHGYVEDMFGRRRYIPEIQTKNHVAREAAERAAINMPIQGANASIIKQAMIALAPQLTAFGAHLLLQVHDELVLEVPDDHLTEVMALVNETMTSAYELKAPLEVHIGYGANWYQAK